MKKFFASIFIIIIVIASIGIDYDTDIKSAQKLMISKENQTETLISVEEIKQNLITNDIKINGEFFTPLPLPKYLLEIYEEKGHIDTNIIAYEDLRYIRTKFFDFDGNEQTGEIVVSHIIAQSTCEIFETIYEEKYPIAKMELLYKYDFSDDASMADNNTSGFNFRIVENTGNLSKHAYGLAIDINPMQNPYIVGDYISPQGSEVYVDRTQHKQGMVLEGDVVYNSFIEHGFTWGGHWYSMKDYQHFQMEIEEE